MSNFEKLEKLNRTTVPIKITIDEQEVEIDIKKIGPQHTNLLKFSTQDAEMSVDELLEKSKPLVKHCGDFSEEQYNKLTTDVLLQLIEKTMSVVMPSGASNNQELLEKAREMRKSKQ